MNQSSESERKHRYLDINAKEDSIVSFSMLLMAFQFVGIAMLVFWVRELIAPVLIGKRIDAEQERCIRELYNLPRSVFLRRTDRGDCHVVAGLGITVLMLPSGVIDKPDTEDARFKIHHELGHFGRADSIVTEMLGVTACLSTLAIAYAVGLHLAGALPFANPQATYLLLLAYVAAVSIGFSRMLRAVHNREFMADTHAMNADPAAYEKHLKAWIRGAKFVETTKRTPRWVRLLSHPSHERRLQFQKDPITISSAECFTIATLTSMVAVLAIALSFSDYATALNVGQWKGLTDEFIAMYFRSTAALSPIAGAALSIVVLWRAVQLVAASPSLPSGYTRCFGYFSGALAGLVMAVLLID